MPVMVAERVIAIALAGALFFAGLVGISSADHIGIVFNENECIQGFYEEYTWEVILCADKKENPDISRIVVTNKNNDTEIKYERKWITKPDTDKEIKMIREILDNVIEAQEDRPWQHFKGKVKKFRTTVGKIFDGI